MKSFSGQIACPDPSGESLIDFYLLWRAYAHEGFVDR